MRFPPLRTAAATTSIAATGLFPHFMLCMMAAIAILGVVGFGGALAIDRFGRLPGDRGRRA